MKRAAIGLGLLLALGAGAFVVWTRTNRPPEANAKRTALSLRVLQEKLGRCQAAGDCAGDVLHLAGITWLEGFIVDAEHEDVVIYGQHLPEWPEQSTADLVVALRNAWLVYAEKREDTLYFSEPGCSIDPDPNVIGQLRNLDGEHMLERWEQVCQGPQTVRVLGIPFDTNFAKIMVDADYFMKRIVNGTAGFRLAQFESLAELRGHQAEKTICQEQDGKSSAFSMNRFWFYPGETLLDVDDGHRTTLVNRCQVTLKTEHEHLAQQGIVGTGAADPLAERFARQFSVRYRDIAEQKPIYKQLEQLYRMVAVAKLLKREPNLPSLEYLLHGFSVPEIPVGRTLAGIYQGTEKTYDCPGQRRASWLNLGCAARTVGAEGGQEVRVTLTTPSCGGVEVAIKVDNPRRRDLSLLRVLALKARPALDALLWVFGGQAA